MTQQRSACKSISIENMLLSRSATTAARASTEKADIRAVCRLSARTISTKHGQLIRLVQHIHTSTHASAHVSYNTLVFANHADPLYAARFQKQTNDAERLINTTCRYSKKNRRMLYESSSRLPHASPPHTVKEATAPLSGDTNQGCL